MTKLKTIASKFLEAESDQLEYYEEFEGLVRSDKSSRLAQVIISMIDTEEIQSSNQFNELVQVMNEYQVEQSIPSIEYNFEPPKELLQEFGIDTSSNGRLMVSKNGEKLEVDDNLDVVGPLDLEGNPAEGHPEFLEAGGEYAEEYREESFEDSQIPFIPEVKRESILPLKSIYAHLPDIGTIEYETLDVVLTKYSINLIFDPSRSKPPFYPKVGLVLELELAEGRSEKVMYSGTCFTYDDKKFISFARLRE